MLVISYVFKRADGFKMRLRQEYVFRTTEKAMSADLTEQCTIIKLNVD